METKAKLRLTLEVLLLWALANIFSHLAVIAIAGKPYFALDPVVGLFCELGIMALNLSLPILALAYMHKGEGPARRDRVKQGIAWEWRGWNTVGWGVAGFIFGFVLLFPVVNLAVGSEPFAYGGGVGPITGQNFYLCFLLPVLLVVTTLGEEVMFRGYAQTGLAEAYGPLAGLLGAALLFSLRHTPADLYWGRDAPAVQWASRLLQLAGGALVLGLVRLKSGSVIATWISHLLGWTYVVFFGSLL